MFGNALLFLSNPFFNECFRVDATFFDLDVEKYQNLYFLKTIQGYLFDDDNTPCYDFDDDAVKGHESLDLLNDRSFFIHLDTNNVGVEINALIEFEDSEQLSLAKEILTNMQGHKTTQNLSSIYTIYFD